MKPSTGGKCFPTGQWYSKRTSCPLPRYRHSISQGSDCMQCPLAKVITLQQVRAYWPSPRRQCTSYVWRGVPSSFEHADAQQNRRPQLVIPQHTIRARPTTHKIPKTTGNTTIRARIATTILSGTSVHERRLEEASWWHCHYQKVAFVFLISQQHTQQTGDLFLSQTQQ